MDDQRRNGEWNIQIELEDFIGTMSDAAAGVGRTVAGAVDTAQTKTGDWKSRFAAGKREPTPADHIRTSAKKRYGAGLALMIAGGVMAVAFLGSALPVLGAASAFTPGGAMEQLVIREGLTGLEVTMSGDVIATLGGFAADFGSAALTVMRITGGLLLAVGAGFLYMVWAGWQRIRASRWLNRCADTADSMDTAEGVSLGLLAEKPAQKPRKILNTVRKYIRRGWLTAWLDEQAGRLYLTAADWRAAQEAKRAPQPAPEDTEEEAAPLSLEAARRFVHVLGQERAVMKDEQAAAELERMQTTAAAICDWLEAHPESLPKARRFAEYYIPTTLRLLHTYNDVQGQKGENAETIRRDIAGILHTLNQAFDSLYDKLLSDMALDVSGEIAALQGMLASDGLTGEELL